MKAAGIERFGGDVRELSLPDPRPAGAGETLIEVRAAGVGPWDDIVRLGSWDVGSRPPMALGVAAAGTVAMRHSLRGQSYGVASACAAGAHAIGTGLRMIQAGDYGKVPEALARAIPALNQLVSKPTMDYLVPLAKLGAAADMARFEMNRSPGMTTPR